MNQKIVPFKVARRILIEIDDKGAQRVTAHDFMIATGTTPENMVMLDLPQARPTDSRMLVQSLIQTVQLHLTAIFQAMQGRGGVSNGATD